MAYSLSGLKTCADTPSAFKRAGLLTTVCHLTRNQQRILRLQGRHAPIVPPRIWVCLLSVWMLSGCAMSAPMHVMHPARLNVPPAARVAFSPIVAKGDLSGDLQRALLAQLPQAQSQLQVLTAADLANASPVRLASTAPLTSDLTAIHAARQADADLLLMGEVVQDDLENVDFTVDNLPPELDRFRSKRRLLLPPSTAQRPQRMAVAWRVFDVRSGRVLGSHTLAIDRYEADKNYPDLQVAFPQPRDRVIAASARQTWQSVTPYVEREQVVLALPWLQPGASQIRRGNGYARIGRWDLAETEWTNAAARNPFSNSAKHNLALAHAAREDFAGAKDTLAQLGPLRLQKQRSKTLVWLDERHRWQHAALGLPPPEGGWSFPDAAVEAARPIAPSTAPSPEDAPWWTSIPFTKPPGWTWRQWLLQPWAL